MKNSHIVLLLLLALAGFILIQKNSPQTTGTTTHQDKDANVNLIAVNEQKLKEIYARRIKENHQSAIVAEANPPSYKDPEKAPIKPESFETSELEPSKENATLTATGEFADEINLPNKKNDCAEPCATKDADASDNPKVADSAAVNVPAVGEHADQINADAIFAQAQQKNPALQPEAKLVDVPTNSVPPTEPGAYSPPQ